VYLNLHRPGEFSYAPRRVAREFPESRPLKYITSG
jgi:hypothetical protein